MRDVAEFIQERGWSRLRLESAPFGEWEGVDLEALRQLFELFFELDLSGSLIASCHPLKSGDLFLSIGTAQERRLQLAADRHLSFLPAHVRQKMMCEMAAWVETLPTRERRGGDGVMEALLGHLSIDLGAKAREIWNEINRVGSVEAVFSDLLSMEEAGFEILSGRGQIMVARHRDLPGFVVKSYPLLRSSERLAARCRNADRIRSLGLESVTAARKWLIPISSEGALLIAEEVEPVAEEISIAALEDLLRLYRLFGPCDGSWGNHPVTKGGKVVWIDTESLGDSYEGPLFEGLRYMLSDEKWRHALEFWETLL